MHYQAQLDIFRNYIRNFNQLTIELNDLYYLFFYISNKCLKKALYA